MAIGTLTTFGSYSFPTRQILIQDNFTNTVPRTVRLPGVSGGYSEFQDEPPPREIGNVSITFWVEKSNAANLQSELDTIRALARNGTQLLTLEPLNTALDDRWCYGVVNNIYMPFNASDAPKFKQRVTINFQVGDPTWWITGPTPPTISVVGAGTATGTITNDGLVTALPIMDVTTGGTLQGITIRRTVGGTVIDSIAYTGGSVLYSGSTLQFDCPVVAITLDSVGIYNPDYITASNGVEWLQLLPGDNVVEVVSSAVSSGTATVSFDYDEGYI